MLERDPEFASVINIFIVFVGLILNFFNQFADQREQEYEVVSLFLPVKLSMKICCKRQLKLKVLVDRQNEFEPII